MKDDIIMGLYNRPETVFSLDEISQVFPAISYESLRDRLYYFSKIGKLKRIGQGLYAKEEYNPLELVNKLYKPSYISLETVLSREGVTFQYYETIFAMSYLSREITLENIKINYRQIKKEVLLNPAGIEKKTGYFMASKERAFLDSVCLYKDYHFDNLGNLDWKKIEDLKKIYQNKTFEKRVKSYYHDYLEEENVKH